MKLSETGSLNNYLDSISVKGAPEPQVGDPATILGWTDRYPATVIGWNGKLLEVQEDEYVRTDTNGISESQEYEYTRDPEGRRYWYKRDARGVWYEVRLNCETGRRKKAGGGLIIGRREKYYDFSF